MALGKAELVKKLSEKTNASQKQVGEFVDAFTETVQETLAQNDKVQLVGFGTFEVRKRSARTGTKPGTGEKINIPESYVPAFKPGKNFKERVNKK